MNKSLFALGLAILLVAITFSQASTRASLKSKSGDFAIENISEQLIEANEKQVIFELDGSPLRGRSNSQRLSFESKRAKGTAIREKAGTMFLQTVTLTGDVAIKQNPGKPDETVVRSDSMTLKEAANRARATVTFSNPVTVVDEARKANLTAQSGSVTFIGGPNEEREVELITLKGGAVAKIQRDSTTTLSTNLILVNQRKSSSVFQFSSPITITDSGKDQSGRARSIKLTGSGGSVTVPKSSQGRPISNANIQGRVTITFDGFDKDGAPLDLVASGDRLTMNESGEILLIGNVKIEGGGLDYESQGTSQTIFIQVDNDMKPLRYGARGNPAKVDIKPDGGGDQ
jgi:lipopolysaccharide export system protein LptA